MLYSAIDNRAGPCDGIVTHRIIAPSLLVFSDYSPITTCSLLVRCMPANGAVQMHSAAQYHPTPALGPIPH